MGWFSAPDNNPTPDQVEDDLRRYEEDAEAADQDHDPSWDGGDNDE